MVNQSRPLGAPSAALDAAKLDMLTAQERSERHAETAKKFEGLIATMLVKELRKALPEGFFGDSPGADTFNGWLDKSLGDNLAANWDLDIAGMVKTDLDLKQAAQDGRESEARESGR